MKLFLNLTLTLTDPIDTILIVPFRSSVSYQAGRSVTGFVGGTLPRLELFL